MPTQWQYTFGILILVFGNIGFSAKAVIIKMAYLYHIDSHSLLALRMLFSLPFYVLVLISSRYRADNQKITGKQWLQVSALGILAYFISSLLDFLGLQYIPASIERLILYAYPTMVLMMSLFFFKKKILRHQYIALGLTYLGILLAFSGEALSSNANNLWIGGLFVFSCAFTYALYVVFTGEVVHKVGSMKFTCYAMISATVIVLLNAWWQNGLHVFHFPKEVYVLAMWLAIVATVLPTFMVAEGIRLVGANNASIIGFVGPVSTIVMGNIFLGEAISIAQILGTIVVGIGVLMISRRFK